jgi:hypothetical protein
MATKRALLIGINYLNNTDARLNGCIADVKNIRGVLIDAYGYNSKNVVVLRDDDPTKMPTKANILVALQSLIVNSGVNDELWIHYSGHGTQLRDTNGDESDRLDEAIVPVDYMTAGMISDDDLFNLIRHIRGRAFLVFDSCHSGSVCDLQYSIHYVNGAFSKIVSSKKIIQNPNIIVMSGSRDAQTSADTFDTTSREFGGALTISLIESLRKNQHVGDVLKIYSDTCYMLKMSGYDQIPVLSSSTGNSNFGFSRGGITVRTVVPTVFAIKPVAQSRTVYSLPKNIPNEPVGETPIHFLRKNNKPRLALMF